MQQKISDLIAALQAAQNRWGDIEVRASWEGVTPEICAIYRGRTYDQEPYTLLLDSGDEFARGQYEHPDDIGLPALWPRPSDAA